MELQIQHIAPYFPYGLKCEYEGLLSGKKRFGSILSISENSVSFEYRMNWSFTAFKPILVPLSEFNDGDAYMFREYIGEGWCDAYGEFFDIWFNDLANIDKLVLQAPLPIFNYFLSRYYDVFGLIAHGLAISK